MTTYQLKLYIAGQSVGSQRASANIRRIMEEELSGNYALEVVDIVQDPQLAEQNRIVATPALIKEAPAPARRVIGDLSDRKKVLLGLEIHGTSTE
jgi:circadian clock protein KaiB